MANTGIFSGVPESPYQSLARERTKTVFGVPVGQFVASLAGGLSRYNPEAGVFGNLAGGFSGSVGAGMGYQQMKHNQLQEQADRERQDIRDYFTQQDRDRTYDLAVRREDRLSAPAPEDQPTNFIGGYRSPDLVGPVQEGAAQLPGQPLPKDVAFTPKAIEAFQASLARNAAEGEPAKKPTQFEQTIEALMAENPKLTRKQVIAGYWRGDFEKDSPRRSGTMHQARHPLNGRPQYIQEDGTVSTNPTNKPYMVKTTFLYEGEDEGDDLDRILGGR